MADEARSLKAYQELPENSKHFAFPMLLFYGHNSALDRMLFKSILKLSDLSYGFLSLLCVSFPDSDLCKSLSSNIFRCVSLSKILISEASCNNLFRHFLSYVLRFWADLPANTMNCICSSCEWGRCLCGWWCQWWVLRFRGHLRSVSLSFIWYVVRPLNIVWRSSEESFQHSCWCISGLMHCKIDSRSIRSWIGKSLMKTWKT